MPSSKTWLASAPKPSPPTSAMWLVAAKSATRRPCRNAGGDDREVVEVAGALPGVVGDEHVALAQGVGGVVAQEAPHRGRHGVDVPGRPRDGLRQHAPLQVEDAGGKVARLPHRGRKGGAHQGPGLFLDHRQQPAPHDLVFQGGEAGPRGLAGAPLDQEVSARQHPRLPARRNDRGGLSLGDQRGAQNRRAFTQIGPQVDGRPYNPLIRAGEEVGPLRGVGCRTVGGGREGDRLTRLRLRRLASVPVRGRGDDQRPAQDLDVEPGNGASVHGFVAAVEGLAQFGNRVLAAAHHRIGQLDADLVALPHVAHVGVGALGCGGTGGARGHHLCRLRPHRGEHPAHQGGIEGGEAHVAALHDLVRDRRQEEPHRRAHPRVSRHDEAVQLELVGEAGRVNRRRSPEGHHGAPTQPLAPLDGVGAGGVGHVLVHHLADPQRGHRPVEPQPAAHPGPDGVLGAAPVEPDRPPREEVGIDAPQHHVRVGDGRLFPTPPVGRRSRLRPGALGTDVNAVEVVHPRDGAAPRPDLHHLDHGDANGQAAALLEAVAAGHLEGAGVERLAAVDHAQLGGGAPHVEGKDIAQGEFAREVAGQDGAAGGAGFDQAHGCGNGGLQGGEAAAAGHEEEGAGEARFAQRGGQTGQVAGHAGLDVGVGARRGAALVLADLGADV